MAGLSAAKALAVAKDASASGTPKRAIVLSMFPPCLRLLVVLLKLLVTLPVSSKGVRSRLAGADAQRLLDRGDEDLAVADLAGVGRLLDRLDGALDLGVVDHDLDLHLGQEAHQVLGAAIDLGLALLATEALDLADGETRHADAGQRIAHLVELERLDDRRNQFHTAFLLPLRLMPADWQKKARRKTRRAQGTAATRSGGGREPGRSGFPKP